METILYFGFNNPLDYKRGVENVIKSQSDASPASSKYYFFFGNKTKVFKWEDIKCVSIKKNFLKFICLNIFVFRVLRKERSKNTVIHSHNYLMSFFLIAKTDIFTIHDGLFYLSNQFQKSKVILFIHSFIEKWVYLRSKKLHFISHFSISKSLLKESLKKKAIIIPNTTPLEEIHEERIKLTDNKPYAFIVRSIEERAFIDLIIEASTHFKDKLNFIIAGKGPLLEHYKELTKSIKADNVLFLGYIKDEQLVSLYKKSTLVILPAKYGEGFGLPIIEGYLFNKPVIASNICAIPEVIISKEFLFNNNPRELINKIDMCLEKFPKYNYFLYYQENFSKKIISEKFQNLYRLLR